MTDKESVDTVQALERMQRRYLELRVSRVGGTLISDETVVLVPFVVSKPYSQKQIEDLTFTDKHGVSPEAITWQDGNTVELS